MAHSVLTATPGRDLWRSRWRDVAFAALWLPLAFSTWTAWEVRRAPLALPLLAENLLIMVLFLARRQSRKVAPSPNAWILAMLGTLAPLLMRPAIALGAQSASSSPLQVVSLGLQGLAVLGILAALARLGRSFGVVPAHRGLVNDGLYGHVRHPIYAFEMAFYVAFVLGNLSVANGAVLVTFIVTQILRAHQEERLLRSDLRYRNYTRRVRFRFIPGLL